MPSQEAIWTALPNGISGDPADRKLLLSVFVSPRLQAGQPQGKLTGPFADWPACLQPGRASFTVQAPGVQPVTATVVSPRPDSALWAALFGPSTTVVPHAFDDLGAQPVYSSYPVHRLHDQLKQSHQQLAADNSALQLNGDRIRNAFHPVLSAIAARPPDRSPGGAGPPGPGARTAGGGSPLADETGPERLRQLHADAARGLLRHDPVTGLDGRLADALTAARRLAAVAPGTQVPLVADTGDPAAPYAQLAAFHRASARAVAAPLTGPPPVIDFHQALTFLADYPDLMRRLGLVIDLQIPLGALPHSATDEPSQRVQVIPVFTPPTGVLCHSPFTAYHLEGNILFEPAPGAGLAHADVPGTPAPLPATELFQGLLNLRPGGPFGAIQLDVDGGGLKVLGMMAGEAGQLAAPPAPSGDLEPAGVPALRSSGVTIARSGHAQALLNQMATAGTNQDRLAGGQEVTFFAEDLLRGYRFDVRDKTSRDWHSLHQRVGTCLFPAHPAGPLTLPIADEGVVQPAITRPPGPDGVQPDPGSPLFIHESLAHWQGWSLSAPRPGKTVTPSGPDTVTSQPPPGGLPVQATFQPLEGSLPRLRFGESYQFRARAVDLAGNGLKISEADARLELIGSLDIQLPVLPGDDAWFTYRRYEPVPAPLLVPREQFTDSECVDRLVIRSRAGSSAQQYASALTAEVAAAAPTATARYRAVSERHLVPPKTSLAMAEAHGTLDAAFGLVTGQEQTYLVAVKEKGSLNDTAVLDTASGRVAPIPDSTDVDPLTGTEVTRPSVELVTTGTTATGERGYSVHHEPQLRLPYLPDPVACGAALFGLPGLPGNGNQAGTLDPAGNLTFVRSALAPDTLSMLGGSTVHIDFGDAWPGRLPFRLQLADPAILPGSDPAPRWDPAERVLTVFLAQAEQVTVRLSSFLSLRNDLSDLENLGLWQWIVEFNQQQGHQPTTDAVQTALQGGHRMITPFRPVKLVHAVEAPLLAPALNPHDLVVPRSPGATFAHIGGTVRVHGKSTAKIDLLATWSEQDDTEPGGPVSNLHSAHVFGVPITLPGETGTAPPSDPGIVPIATYDPAGDLITLQAPAPGDQPGRTYLARQEFGDTRHRKVSYGAMATSRFREYFPPVVSGDLARITVTGEAVDIDVPSSERPPAPAVVSVLPTFRWTRRTNPDGSRQSVRRGGVRVYLDRPWFSSGDGELLGVVLTSPSFYPPSPQLAPFVTHWGQNPAFTGTDGLGTPTVASFPGAVSTRTDGLKIDELAGLAGLAPGAEAVSVAGHSVEYDPDRRLWSCDIDVSDAPDQVYCPYLQLALARYQPNSLPSLELSRVIRTDLVQVVPQRTVTVTPVPGQTSLLDVVVTGISYIATSWQAGDDQRDGISPEKNPPHDMVQVSVQQRIPGTQDDLGWVFASPGNATFAAQAGGDPPAPGSPLWHGQVRLPASSSPRQFRILVQEFEHVTTDLFGSFEAMLDDPGLIPPHQIVTDTFHPGADRLVFAETIPL